MKSNNWLSEVIVPKKLRLLWYSIRNSGIGLYLLKVLSGVLLVMLLPISIVFKLSVFFAMNFFLALAGTILYLVLTNKYLENNIEPNFITLGLTFITSTTLAVYVLSITSIVNTPEQLAQPITLFGIAITIMSHISGWIFVRVAYEGGEESKVDGFPLLYTAIIIALIILKLTMIAIALSL